MRRGLSVAPILGGYAITLLRRPPIILHYHAIGDVPRQLDPYNLVIDPEQLTVQLKALVKRGYRFVVLSELVDRLQTRAAAGLCAVTFDDGSSDNLSILPALLRDFDAPATVYVCPGRLGLPHHAIAPEAKIRLMTAEELRALADCPGFELGSHTLAHTDLGAASHAEALEVMTESKSQLEALIGRRVDSFAYPFCTYSPACPTAAREAGYGSAVTCGSRGGWNQFELRRVSPDRVDTPLTFWLKTRYLFNVLRSSTLAHSVARRVRRQASGVDD